MNAVHHGFILRELVKRDFHSRYAGSALGVGWSLLHPFWQLLLFSFVFGLVMRIEPPPELTKSFAIFLFSGLVPWIAVQEGVQRSAAALTDNATLIKKLSFPPQLLVLTSVLGGFIQSLLAALVLVLVLVFRGELSLPTLPWLLLIIPLQLALTLGLGLIFSAVNVFLRDVSQVLGIVLNAWFYVTPIVYPLSLLDPTRISDPAKASTVEAVRGFIEANPLTAIVQIYRHAFLGGPTYHGNGLWVLVGASVLLLGLGWLLFARLRPGFADEL